MDTAKRHSCMDSPIGKLLLTGTLHCLTGVYMLDHKGGPDVLRCGPRDDAAFAMARGQLAEYFAGERRCFDLAFTGQGTPFQRRVWQALTEIPFGGTISYGELARRIGQPTAARAVGLANGQNPISIVVPCHRVMGANGALTGYGGGIERKRWLLAHEARQQRLC